SDPSIGVPMVWPHAPCVRRTWHTSLDTPDVVDFGVIGRMAAVVGAFLLEVSQRKHLPLKPVKTVGQESLQPGRSPTPTRLGIGPISLDPVPSSQWPEFIKSSPRWSRELTRALWLADGRRTLHEI